MRVFLITGASSGIGAATARAVATSETALVLHARKNRSGLEKVADAARAAGAQTLLVEGDLAVPGTATRLVEETTAKFGRLDVVVSNAGFADRRPIGEVDRAALDASLAAMTAAFFDLVTAARPWLVEAGTSGRVIGVSSFVAHAFGRGKIGRASCRERVCLQV
jgi:3-oxoacyl-[acyl-carrier protein] reductase